jgi:hypothetical protein
VTITLRHYNPDGTILYEHPMEGLARDIWERIERMTGWREEKIRWWFEHCNPLLGNVPPVWMLTNDKGHRLLKFVQEAEELNEEVMENVAVQSTADQGS